MKAYLIGYDTCEYGHINKVIDVESKEEAQKWCDENSYMGGYDWYIESISKE